MKTNKVVFLTIIILIIVSIMLGCTNMKEKEESSQQLKKTESSNKELSIYGDVYRIALEAMIPIDDALNSNMKYIAINTATLENATDEDVLKIMEYFKKYEVNVIDESFQSLKEKGMVKNGSIDGILLKIERIEKISDDKVIVEGSKFRSGNGAIGVTSILVRSKGEWKLESAGITWIS